MTAQGRRPGAENLALVEVGSDPAAVANQVQIYAKDVAGVTQFFVRASDGTVSQISPPSAGGESAPQLLVSPRYGGANVTVALSTNGARAMFVGYAYRDFAAGEVFPTMWEVTLAGNTFTWGEIAIGTGAFVPGTAPEITPVGFVDVAAEMAAQAEYVTSIPISGGEAIAKNDGIWLLFAKASTGSPTLQGLVVENMATGIICSLATAGWRPSSNIGVAATWTIDTAAAGIKTITVPPIP